MTDPDQPRDSDEPEYGSLTVEDDPGGTTDPADLAHSASDNAEAGHHPSVSEADDMTDRSPE